MMVLVFSWICLLVCLVSLWVINMFGIFLVLVQLYFVVVELLKIIRCMLKGILCCYCCMGLLLWVYMLLVWGGVLKDLGIIVCVWVV